MRIMENDLPVNRDSILKLMEKKDEIESQLRELKTILDGNNIGMSEPLIDREGYPRQDIDVYQVRQARHKIICLQNDHKAIMREIEKGIHFLHSQPGVSTSSNNGNNSKFEQEARPFAAVTQVDPDSPAYFAGLQVNDEILSFGSINSGNFKSVQDIISVVQHSVGKSVILLIKRDHHVKRVSLTPKEWKGKGLLGCVIKAYDDIDR